MYLFYYLSLAFVVVTMLAQYPKKLKMSERVSRPAQVAHATRAGSSENRLPTGGPAPSARGPHWPEVGNTRVQGQSVQNAFVKIQSGADPTWRRSASGIIRSKPASKIYQRMSLTGFRWGLDE